MSNPPATARYVLIPLFAAFIESISPSPTSTASYILTGLPFNSGSISAPVRAMTDVQSKLMVIPSIVISTTPSPGALPTRMFAVFIEYVSMAPLGENPVFIYPNRPSS